MKKVEDYVRSIPDFPEKGIIFRDITSVIQSPEGLKLAIDGINESLKDVDYDVVVGPESRGFIFGVPVAYVNGKGFVPVRKKGKLPCETISEDYSLEYGTATIEMHKDAIVPGQKVVIVDDLIATGGTTEAIIKLIERLGGEVVKIVFLIELEGLNGREKLAGYDVDYDVVVGPESRGFIFGVPVAYVNGKGFVPVRKKGKLPCETISEDYSLEYGTATIEMHKDAIVPGQKVVIVDDLIATGGTTEAIIKLIERLGGEVVKIVFLIELEGLNGREKLAGYDVDSVIKYAGK